MTENRGPIVHLPRPKTLKDWLYRYRFMLVRRSVQMTLLLLFMGTSYWGWTVGNRPVLSGDYSGSLILGAISLNDPLATLERLLAGALPTLSVLLGSLFVLGFYALIGSRAFCAWVCPMNVVTETAAWVRRVLGVKTHLIKIDRMTRHYVLLGTLLASTLSGSAVFEMLSPQAILWRDLIFGFGLGALLVTAFIFFLDVFLIPNAWCGHLCPLGAFYGIVGKKGVVRIEFDDARCTHCSDCIQVCPESQIMKLSAMAERGTVEPGACTLCGKCIEICPEKALKFNLVSLTKQKGEKNES